MIRDGYYMSATDAQEELEEVQADLKKREDEVSITYPHPPPRRSLKNLQSLAMFKFIFYLSRYSV